MPGRRVAARPRSRKEVNYTWSVFRKDLTVVPAATKVLLGFFFLDTAFEETVVRTRGIFSINTDQVASLETQQGAFGMVRVTDRAIAAGAASIPGPVTDGDDDGWFVWVPFTQQSTVSTDASSMRHYQIDSKAQRIVREGQQLAVMFENAGSEGLRLTLILRALSRFRS